jgi:hypothetical protein
LVSCIAEIIRVEGEKRVFWEIRSCGLTQFESATSGDLSLYPHEPKT